MSQDDPFFVPDESERTVVRPVPGGRRMGGAAAPATPPPKSPPRGYTERLATSLPMASGINPLVRCASSLLVVAGQLRNSLSHSDADGLRNQLAREIREFEACARAQGIADSTVLPARYVLCSLLDEAVLGTPWGSESLWAKQGLLISFHKEAWGGEKFFQALDRLIAYPSGNLHMLELMYLCLGFGFEGRYRVREGGRDQLEAVRERLYQTIRAQRGEPERELSPHWRGVAPPRDPLIQMVPLWVLSAVAVALLLAMFTAFRFALHRDSEPLFLRVASLDVAAIEAPRPAPPPIGGAPEPLTLRKLLKDEIQAGKLEVIDRPGGEMIRIRGDGLFASGKVTIKESYLPILERIGAALVRLPGRVLVTGHTDAAPIRSRRFASNQQLSEERAESVRKKLDSILGDPARVSTKGKGAAELLVQDSPKDARNRRVEITLWRTANAGGQVSP